MVILLIIAFILIKILIKIIKYKSKNKFNNYELTIGFFHPFCNAGGGGERVLWSAIKIIQDTYPNIMCVVYTGDIDCTVEYLVDKVNKRFQIKIDSKRLHFIYLHTRFLVLDKYYPIFTLLGQSLASIIVAFESLSKFIPDIYFETTGYAFTYPIYYYLASIPICCYIHYPTISIDMLKNVSNRNETFNNRQLISKSYILTNGKLFYYKIFAKLYSFCGRCACVAMVNSKWTLAHINSLWSLNNLTNIVYPPCDIEEFSVINNPKRDENFYIASLAQFRPEKNHQLQLKSFAKFLKTVGTDPKIKLILIGSVRNEDDEMRVNILKNLSNELEIQNNIEFRINISFDELKNSLSESAVGLHSMKEEHFGIGIVECMASGTIILAHNSGGPKEDIVIPYNNEKTGYLADTLDEYCKKLMEIFNLNLEERNKIRNTARIHVKKFSQNEFNRSFMEIFNRDCLKKFNLLRIKYD